MNYKQTIVIITYLILIINPSWRTNAQTTFDRGRRFTPKDRRFSLVPSPNVQRFASHSGEPYGLFFGVLTPIKGPHRLSEWTVRTVMPTIELAIKKVQSAGGLLENFNISIEHRDTECSSTYGPLAAFEFHTKRKPG